MVWVLLLLKPVQCGDSCRCSLGNDHVSLIFRAKHSSSCFLIGQTDNFPDPVIIPELSLIPGGAEEGPGGAGLFTSIPIAGGKV